MTVWLMVGDCVHCVADQLGLEATPEGWVTAMVEVLRDDGTVWCNIGDSYTANQGSGFNGNAGKATASPRMSTGLASKQLLMMPAHEHIYLLSKRPRYYYDADAAQPSTIERDQYRRTGNAKENGCDIRWNYLNPAAGEYGRTLRNVWTIATEAFSDRHFATFPTGLAERCIKAGTSEKGCCAAWQRMSDKAFVPTQDPIFPKGGRKGVDAMNGWGNVPRGRIDASVVPCTVLDPFAGAGTTLLVADSQLFMDLGPVAQLVLV